MDIRWSKIAQDKLFAAIIALGAVGLQRALMVGIDRAYPEAMLAQMFIIFTTVALLTFWVNRSTKTGLLASVISSLMIFLYSSLTSSELMIGQILLLGASTMLIYWLMHCVVSENKGEFTADQATWMLAVFSGVLGSAYIAVPVNLIRMIGLGMNATEPVIRFVGILLIIFAVGLILKEIKKRLLNLRIPNLQLARFFRVVGTVTVICSVSVCIILGYKFLYMYGQNSLMGEPGWHDVVFDDPVELAMMVSVLSISLALSVGFIAFNSAEAVTGSLIAATALLLFETINGNFTYTIQNFLIQAIIFCLSALMVLEAKGETLWQ